MLEINSDFEIRLENAGVKFQNFTSLSNFWTNFIQKKKKRYYS